MSDHKWRKDADGAESCEREGCSVRRYLKGGGITWQVKKRTHWFQSSLTPIPPCTGKEAGEETVQIPLTPFYSVTAPAVKVCLQCQGPHATEACMLGADVHLRPKPAPSPLEVVREALETFQNMGGTVWASERKMAVDGLRALATLEESIRADERRKVADELELRGHQVTSMAVRNM